MAASGPVGLAGGDAAPIRFGLTGTDHWARIVHAPALASTPGVELTAIWGRNRATAGALGADFDATAYQDFDAFLADVDAVAFAVPPGVQAQLAVQAAEAGRHLLLEKPIALTDDAADALVRAVAASGVASAVFFTDRFQPDIRRWLDGSRTRAAGRAAARAGSARPCRARARSIRRGGATSAACGTSVRMRCRRCGPSWARYATSPPTSAAVT
jgi:predicted dehydrogenase